MNDKKEINNEQLVNVNGGSNEDNDKEKSLDTSKVYDGIIIGSNDIVGNKHDIH